MHVISRRLMIIALAALFGLAGCSLPTSNNGNTEETIGGVPVVTIASPSANATYAQDVPVNIQVSVMNAGDNIERIEYSVDNETIASIQAPNPANADIFSSTQTWPAGTVGTHSIGVIVYRIDGTSSIPASVQINVVESESNDDTGIIDTQPTAEQQAVPTESTESEPTDVVATDVPQPTTPPQTDPTEPAQPATPETPMAVFTQGINVRSGPGLNFAPPIGQFIANQTAEILATNFGGTWLKVRFGNGEGWVFADLVEIQGNLASVPQEAGPPTPVPTTPPTATPIPATATPAATNNLVVIDPFINPAQPQCGQQFTVGMSIRNDGTASSSTGLSRIRIVRASDGTQIASSEGALVAVDLESGGVHRVTFNFTVDVFVNETHRVEFTADANNAVAETIETDNVITVDYTLPSC